MVFIKATIKGSTILTECTSWALPGSLN